MPCTTISETLVQRCFYFFRLAGVPLRNMRQSFRYEPDQHGSPSSRGQRNNLGYITATTEDIYFQIFIRNHRQKRWSKSRVLALTACPTHPIQVSNDLVEMDKRNMGEPNRIEDCMELIEANLEVSDGLRQRTR